MNLPTLYPKYQALANYHINQIFVPRILDFMSWQNWTFTEGNFLDYGCGPGTTAYIRLRPTALHTLSDMYFVDISPKMVKFAQENYPHPNFHYAVGTVPENFPFKNVQFDRIFALNVFHFVPDIKKMLQGFWDIMKPGAYLGFSFLTPNESEIKIWEELSQTSEWGPYMKNYQCPKWCLYGTQEPVSYFRNVFLEGTGFEEMGLGFQKTQPKEKGVDESIEFMASLNPCLDEIPEHLHSELTKEYKRILTKTTGKAETETTLSTDVECVYGALRKPKI